MRGITAVFVLACAVPACVASSSDDETDATTAPLRVGVVTRERPEVGRMMFWSGSQCTATLVARRAVITAAHCVGFRSESKGVEPHGVFRIETRDGVMHQARFDGYRSFGSQGGRDDIALLHLVEDDLLADLLRVAKPARLATRGPSRGEAITLYGYGACGRPESEKRRFAFRWGDDEVDTLCPGDSGGPSFVRGEVFRVSSGAQKTLLFSGSNDDVFAHTPDDQKALLAQIEAWDAG